MSKSTKLRVSDYVPDTSQSLRVEKIANGFLSHHSMSGPDIVDGYKSETHYHRTNPIAPGKRAQIGRTLAKLQMRRKHKM